MLDSFLNTVTGGAVYGLGGQNGFVTTVMPSRLVFSLFSSALGTVTEDYYLGKSGGGLEGESGANLGYLDSRFSIQDFWLVGYCRSWTRYWSNTQLSLLHSLCTCMYDMSGVAFAERDKDRASIAARKSLGCGCGT